MKWQIVFVLFLSGCALFDDVEPSDVPEADAGLDATNELDQGAVDSGQDMAVLDDVGIDASDLGDGSDLGPEMDAAMDVGPDLVELEPFDCPTQTLTDGAGNRNAGLQIESFSSDALVVGWHAEGTLIIFNEIRPGEPFTTVTTSAPVNRQDFVILPDPFGDRWYFAASNGELAYCDSGTCSLEGTFYSSNVQAVTGEWRGGTEPIHLQFYDSRDVVSGTWIGTGLTRVMTYKTSLVTSPDWIDLALIGSGNPTFQGMTGGAVFSGDFYYHERRTEAEPGEPAGRRCQVSPAVGSKFELTATSGEVITTYEDNGSTRVGVGSCDSPSATFQTLPIAELRDWVVLERDGKTYTFYATDTELRLDVLERGRITPYSIALGDFYRVDATFDTDGDFALVTIDGAQLVQLHRFKLDGTCLL